MSLPQAAASSASVGTLRAFHDALATSGGLPPALAERAVLDRPTA